MFVDVVTRLAESLEAAQDGNNRMEKMAECKLLDFNFDKSCAIVIGSKKFRRVINEKYLNKPITLCNRPMKIVESEKYLGDQISSSLSESVFLTIQRRQGLVKRLISEIKFTVEDCRSNVTGGLVTGIEIWRLAVIPFLYYNSECCIDIPKKALKILNQLQSSFFTTLFKMPHSCPTLSYLWDTATLKVDNFLIMKKLLFYHHLQNLPDSSLAKELFSIQKENQNNFPSLVSECLGFLSDLGISSNPSIISKPLWKKIVKKKVHQKNREELLQQAKSYKKLDFVKLSSEEYGMHSYVKSMTVSSARVFFASRAQMLATVQHNFKHKPEYVANQWRCVCSQPDLQAHLQTCSSYLHLQQGLNLQDDNDLVRFYQLVIEERTDKQENNNN